MTRQRAKMLMALVSRLLRETNLTPDAQMAADEFDAYRSEWEQDLIELAEHRRGQPARELKALQLSVAGQIEDLESPGPVDCFGRWGK